MKVLKILAAAAIVAVPALLGSLPAEALTSRQYAAQGHGRYVNSSGTRMMRGAFHHRRYRFFRRHHHRHHF